MKGIGFNIRNLQNFSDKPHKNTKIRTTPGQNIEFNKILSNSLEPEKSEIVAAQNKNLSGLSEISPGLSEISAPSHVSFMNYSPAEISDRVDHTLDLLEKYSSMLSDPLKTLKSIDPVLKDINISAKSIADELKTKIDSNTVAGQDHELVKIVNQILTIANIEAFKMNRGDYTDR